MSDEKFKIVKQETLFQGFFSVERYHIEHQRFDGSWSNRFTREVFHRARHVSGAILFDPLQDKVVLIEQFRPGPLRLGDNPWMTEIVMGMVDEHETAEQAVRREAKEESGCDITSLQHIAAYYSSPGGTSEHISLFVGRVQAPADGGICGLKEENEDIRVRVLDAANCIGMLYANKIRDAQTLIALQWFAMHHTELRSQWLVSEVGTPII